MPFFIVTEHSLILPGEYENYESACDGCDAGDIVFVADSRRMLEETLNAETSE
ncbi:MAG: hypothetical protein U9N81_06195 [Bacillota bacterium]|nr:hypothetical protein [Bacillota bacterium]